MKILNFPQLRQTYEYDCGAKALQSVFAYFGIELRQEIIMNEVKTSKEGTSVINIEKTIKKYKLKIDSREMAISDIKKYIDKKIPVIILLQAWSNHKKTSWEKNWKDGHYVVAIGYDKKRIYFEDPSTFYTTYLTFKEFKERWHDIDKDGKKYFHHGIAVFGRKPRFNSNKIIHMD